MSYQGRYASQKSRKPQKSQKPQKTKKRGGRVVLIILLTLLGLLLTAVVGGVIYYNHLLDQITTVEADENNVNLEAIQGLLPPVEETEEVPKETAEEATVPEETKPMTADDIVNIMIIGNSSRAGEDARMADTAILASINKYTHTLTLTSVLRDSLVKLPIFKNANGKTVNGGKIKFTTCYNLGYKYGNNDVGWAMEIINKTMEENFGVEVDYDFEVDFDGFIALVDKLGGVVLEFTQDEADYINNALGDYTDAEEGWQHVDGYVALTYARMRHAKNDGDSDIKRTSRQRYLIERLIKQLREQDIATINAAISEVLPYITTNMPKEEINSLVLELIPMLTDLKIESGTCPVEGTYRGDYVDIYKDDTQHSVLIFDAAQQKKLMRAITEGEIIE